MEDFRNICRVMQPHCLTCRMPSTMSSLKLRNWHKNQTPRHEKTHNKAKFQQYFGYIFSEAHEQDADEDLDHGDWRYYESDHDSDNSDRILPTLDNIDWQTKWTVQTNWWKNDYFVAGIIVQLLFSDLSDAVVVLLLTNIILKQEKRQRKIRHNDTRLTTCF